MSRINHIVGLAVVAILLSSPQVAPAGITAVNLGLGPPLTTLGPYQMTPFGPELRPDFSVVTSVPSPLGGSLNFSNPMDLVSVPPTGVGWATWSHGAAPRVYATPFDNPDSVTLIMPPGTGAFQFWAEPNEFGQHTITAVADDGTTLQIPIIGFEGATGFGFYADPGQSLVSITISAPPEAETFGLAEFAIAQATIPEPSTMALFGVGMVGLLGYFRRRMQ